MPTTTHATELLTPAQAAKRLSVDERTLSNWRCNQRYALPYIKIGGKSVRYRAEDIAAFIERHIVHPATTA